MVFLLVLIGLVGVVHGAAHIALGMVAPPAELLVIVGLYYVLPGVALARRRFAWLAFAGIGAHGTLRHFVLDGDHVHAAARDTSWGIAFTSTAVLLSALALIGLVATAARPLAHRVLGRFDRTIGVEATYLHEILDASFAAFCAFAAFFPLSTFRKRLPRACWHAARIVATRHADCGSCVQITVSLALADGVDANLVRSLLPRAKTPEEALPEDVRDVVEFTERVMRHSHDEDGLRTKLRARYGDRGMIDLAYAIAGSQVVPYTKKVLGHGVSCTEVTCA